MIGWQPESGRKAADRIRSLHLHTDLSEIVTMLSLSKAKTGGLGRLCATVTVYNEILDCW